jgi:hypothetical protein
MLRWRQSVRADRLRRLHLFHQVVVPLALDPEVRGGAKLDSLDEIMRDVGVDAGLTERIERRAGRSTADEPGLQAGFGRIGELAGFPNVVAVTSDEMRTGIAVGLGAGQSSDSLDFEYRLVTESGTLH